VTATPNVGSGTAVSGAAATTATLPARTDDAPRPARVVDPRGRAKILRPLPAAEREAAVARGLAAYARGDFYLAHEDLEPAWMGTADPAERELLAGLIKLAAAFVHASRGNPAGAATNLRGARVRLTGAATGGRDGGLDIPAVLSAIDDRLALLETGLAVSESGPTESSSGPTEPASAAALQVADPPHDVAGPPGRARRPPLALEPPAIERRRRT
jgi:predicted metal-dependent hydrolase